MKTLREFIDSKPTSKESAAMSRYIGYYEKFRRRTLYAKKIKYRDYQLFIVFMAIAFENKQPKLNFDALFLSYAKELKRIYRLRINPTLWEKRLDKWLIADHK